MNHIVFRMIPDAADREDVCQDVFMKVYQNLASFRSDSKLSTWIAAIAYNRCVDCLSKRRISPATDCYDEAVMEIADDALTPDGQLESADLSNRLQNEIEKLPVPFRTIITLYHLEEMSYTEIGAVMSLPEGTVKSYLFRARKLLKERLAAKHRKEEWRP